MSAEDLARGIADRHALMGAPEPGEPEFDKIVTLSTAHAPSAQALADLPEQTIAIV